ncbi:MAG: hypothetical protein BWY93_01338 [Euryarchaeota archaeon ADurb.BinA087]|nr:MAG: hypothetical protein BWY93_01338 [Euryarchaeota archaeon ADurb.BinA087]
MFIIDDLTEVPHRNGHIRLCDDPYYPVLIGDNKPDYFVIDHPPPQMHHAFFSVNSAGFFHYFFECTIGAVHLEQILSGHLTDKPVILIIYHDNLVCLKERDQDLHILVRVDRGEVLFYCIRYMD